jgi:hypothetical protein
MKRQPKKLHINPDTLRRLTTTEIRSAHGGDPTSQVFTLCLSNCPQCPSFAAKTCPP